MAHFPHEHKASIDTVTGPPAIIFSAHPPLQDGSWALVGMCSSIPDKGEDSHLQCPGSTLASPGVAQRDHTAHPRGESQLMSQGACLINKPQEVGRIQLVWT